MTDYHESWDGDSGSAAAGTEDPPPRPNFFKRLWMAIVKPGELFEALAANPAWFPMAAFVAVAVGISLCLLPAEAFYEAAVANTPPDQQAALRDQPWELYKWFAAGGATVFVMVLPVFLSLLSYVIFVFIRGDRATFKQHLCVMSHAGIITALGALATVPIRTINHAQDTLALGDLTPFLDGYLYDVLNGVDLFALWATIAAGLGLSLLDPRRRWAPTAAVLVVILLLSAMIGPTLVALFVS
ncbi:MAG: hypothetical protein F4123_08165 [Gemmatimonadetes bacterium]|nr:hypothetical protein [Gemmatimonadota bacterium]MYB97249.1 hypothetical protein [Gemmatimonadota bacterium]MYI46330.1 hypothetical protein [Gemmatimonadota bacterium]